MLDQEWDVLGTLAQWRDLQADHLESLMDACNQSHGGGTEPAPIEMPIDGTLDLHVFRPQEVGELVPDYLAACRQRGILQVRIVHGKGTGALRRTVHTILERLPYVDGFRLGGTGAGGWGATLAFLLPLAAGEGRQHESEQGTAHGEDT